MNKQKIDDRHKQCIKCGIIGELNKVITYFGHRYICWDCHDKLKTKNKILKSKV